MQPPVATAGHGTGSMWGLCGACLIAFGNKDLCCCLWADCRLVLQSESPPLMAGHLCGRGGDDGWLAATSPGWCRLAAGVKKGAGGQTEVTEVDGDDDGVLELQPHFQYVSGLR